MIWLIWIFYVNKVTIKIKRCRSIDAYMALHDGRFDLLETVVSAEDDTVSIILKSKGRKLYANSVEAFKKSLKG